MKTPYSAYKQYSSPGEQTVISTAPPHQVAAPSGQSQDAHSTSTAQQDGSKVLSNKSGLIVAGLGAMAMLMVVALSLVALAFSDTIEKMVADLPFWKLNSHRVNEDSSSRNASTELTQIEDEVEALHSERKRIEREMAQAVAGVKDIASQHPFGVASVAAELSGKSFPQSDSQVWAEINSTRNTVSFLSPLWAVANHVEVEEVAGKLITLQEQSLKASEDIKRLDREIDTAMERLRAKRHARL